MHVHFAHHYMDFERLFVVYLSNMTSSSSIFESSGEGRSREMPDMSKSLPSRALVVDDFLWCIFTIRLFGTLRKVRLPRFLVCLQHTPKKRRQQCSRVTRMVRICLVARQKKIALINPWLLSPKACRK